MPSLIAALFDQGLLKTVIETLITSGLLLLILIGGFLRSKLLERLYVRVIEATRDRSPLTPETAVGHAMVNTRLIKILNELQAMRVCVFQFHNGDRFMLSNHSWKVSASHEVVRPGTSPTMKDNQRLQVSSIADVIAPMMDPTFKVSGASLRPGCVGKDNKCPHARAGARRVMRFHPKDMPYTLVRQLADQQHIPVFYTVSLLSPEGQVFGFVGIQFDQTDADERVAAGAGLCMVCEEVEAIEYFLTESRRRKSLPWYRRWLGLP